ncbi:hypothetical protein [Streptacidiphilus rugosus]|uniref:hypothetical protein n=1 Tax=Streptacidiphilus rugosus TaxID=405783 RepID=UPI00056B2E0E|nr:hypothetical protein [Streptacidiphilus rugosus]
MKHIVAGHEAATTNEFVALAFGIDRQLFAGVPGETPLARAARLDVAAEVLAELDEIDPQAARFAAELMRTAPVPLRRPAVVRRRPARTGVAA